MCEEKTIRLSRQDELELEAYRTINACIDNDTQAGSIYDRIIMPIILFAPVYAVQYPKSKILAYTGGMILLLSMIGRMLRGELRTKVRHDIMREIEEKLGFRAHLEVRKRIRESSLHWIRDYTVKWVFVIAVLCVYIINIMIAICKWRIL